MRLSVVAYSIPFVATTMALKPPEVVTFDTMPEIATLLSENCWKLINLTLRCYFSDVGCSQKHIPISVDDDAVWRAELNGSVDNEAINSSGHTILASNNACGHVCQQMNQLMRQRNIVKTNSQTARVELSYHLKAWLGEIYQSIWVRSNALREKYDCVSSNTVEYRRHCKSASNCGWDPECCSKWGQHHNCASKIISREFTWSAAARCGTCQHSCFTCGRRRSVRLVCETSCAMLLREDWYHS